MLISGDITKTSSYSPSPPSFISIKVNLIRRRGRLIKDLLFVHCFLSLSEIKICSKNFTELSKTIRTGKVYDRFEVFAAAILPDFSCNQY